MNIIDSYCEHLLRSKKGSVFGQKPAANKSRSEVEALERERRLNI